MTPARFVLAAVVVGAFLAVLAGPDPAGASLFVAPGPDLPGRVTVGRPFTARLGVGNYSTSPESQMVPLLPVSKIDLVLSCGHDVHDCANGVEAGVFDVAPKPRGSGPASCKGTWGVAQVVPGVFRFTPPGGEASLQLANREVCIVEFTATPLRMPSVDTTPEPGTQTNQIATATAQVLGVVPVVRVSSPDQTTVAPRSSRSGTIGDYDGDGTTDAALYQPSTGTWYLKTASPRFVVWGGVSGDVPVPGDYDGDGITDVAVYRPSVGTWYIKTPAAQAVAWGGVSGDVPVPGDYDGDGITDVAVYRPSAGTWYIKTATPRFVVWGGVSGDVPVPGDYDGDGITDVAVYRPSVGTWYIKTPAAKAVAWGGVSGDVPVPGDYDGDGITDVAVYRPSAGTWYIKTATPRFVVWGGVRGDVPVPGDYDGDGTTDVAVYRPSTGAWYLRNSGGGSAHVVWGVSGGVAVVVPPSLRGL